MGLGRGKCGRERSRPKDKLCPPSLCANKPQALSGLQIPAVSSTPSLTESAACNSKSIPQ